MGFTVFGRQFYSLSSIQKSCVIAAKVGKDG